MKFYDLQGNLIGKERFIDLYSEVYYYSNSIYTEKQIEEIYSKQKELTVEDITAFLKWKVGDKTQGQFIQTQYGKNIPINKIDSLVCVVNDKASGRDVESIYRSIIAERIKYVGSVYALALISLISKGEEPIYDKFADTALKGIIGNNDFRSTIEYEEMPDKENVNKVMSRYKEYKDALKSVFGDEWKKTRNVDRALWTYGHTFEIR